MKVTSRILSLSTALAVALGIGQSQAAVLMSSEQTVRNVENLTHDIEWKTGLPQAEWEAKHDHKLVFWMHMLGNLTGAT